MIQSALHPGVRRTRKGTIYILVLVVASIVTVIGVSAVTLNRVQARSIGKMNNWSEAGALAFSAIEFGLNELNQASNWRSNYSNNTEYGNLPLGNGTISWKVIDETDNNLANDDTTSVRMYGIGRVGDAERIYSVLLQPVGEPLDVLRTATHANDRFEIDRDNVYVTASGGPLSTNDEFRRRGVVNGNIEANSVTGVGVVNGIITVPAPQKPMPSNSVYSSYRSKATKLNWPSPGGTEVATWQFEPGLLSATENPYGDPNPEGIYHVKIPNNGWLRINKSRIVATLVIHAPQSADLWIDPEVCWEAPRQEFPLLIVKGNNLKVDIESSATGVSEASIGKNMNPPGTPYQEQSDNDMLDVYPAELHGLMHVMCASGERTYFGKNVRIVGCYLTDGEIRVGSSRDSSAATTVNLTADLNLYYNPPVGYTAGSYLLPLSGTWQWEVNP